MSTLAASRRLAEVLLVEDGDNEAELTTLSFRDIKPESRLHRVRDGVECLAFLRKEPPYADAPTPDLVLLDLNMPRMDGREVLAEVAGDESLRHIPIVVLSTSDSPQDVLQSYRRFCNSYVVKPVSFTEFTDLIRAICSYWFTVVELPPETEA